MEISKLKTAVLQEMAKLNSKAGWTMQIHFGAMRNNNSKMYKTIGPDSGFDSIADGAIVFHAGTKKHDDKILSNGGRVLGVTALGDTLDSAITNAYSAAEKIVWSNKYFRKDIGQKGLSYI